MEVESMVLAPHRKRDLTRKVLYIGTFQPDICTSPAGAAGGTGTVPSAGALASILSK